MADGRILIVADHAVGLELAARLQTGEWKTITEELGSAALTTAIQQRPWLILVHAPEVEHSHVLFCRTVRQLVELENTVLVGLIVSKDAEARSTLLDSGADDCWSETSSSEDFLLHLRKAWASQHPEQKGLRLKWGDIELDTGMHRFWVKGAAVRITKTQQKLLEHFLWSPCVTFSETELLAQVWQDRSIHTATVAACIRRTCKALSEAGAETLIRKVGDKSYRLD